jgi:hypothetical protein
VSRRRREVEEVLSLDSFLDIVTNVVGVLILVAVVTVLSAGDITISSGATALRAPPKAAATRILVECARDQAFVVDEEKNAQKVREAVEGWKSDDFELSGEAVATRLEYNDIGDENHRVQAEIGPLGLAWIYKLRARAHGDTVEELEGGDSKLEDAIRDAGPGTYVYFVVQEDSFDVFRAARELARSRGLSTGWHPVEKRTPLRISSVGSLGKRVQ